MAWPRARICLTFLMATVIATTARGQPGSTYSGESAHWTYLPSGCRRLPAIGTAADLRGGSESVGSYSHVDPWGEATSGMEGAAPDAYGAGRLPSETESTVDDGATLIPSRSASFLRPPSADTAEPPADAFGTGGGDIQLRGLSSDRSSLASGPSASLLTGSEAQILPSSNAGKLLSDSAIVGVGTQNRNPITTDIRTRGTHVGQILASGSYWIPARIDMDTAFNKFDSHSLEDVIILKGPYSSRLGPGFSFIDFGQYTSPRYPCCPQVNGDSFFDYRTNGERLYSRHVLRGGAERYGFRACYAHRSGEDYRDGSGQTTPGSYKSQMLNVALGWNPHPHSQVEFSYRRLSDRVVDFPTIVFDMDFLEMDAYRLNYRLECRVADELTFEVWNNRTSLAGNAQGPKKRLVAPILDTYLDSGFTNASVMSTGYSLALSWGTPEQGQLTLGTDLRFVEQEVNELDKYDRDLLPPGVPAGTELNYPLPQSSFINPGLFLACSRDFGSSVTVTAGARVDWSRTTADEIHPDFGSMETVLGGDFDQSFEMASAFVSAQYDFASDWEASVAVGYAMRPPLLAELYTFGSQLTMLQGTRTIALGNPNLRPGKLCQIDVALHKRSGRLRGSVEAFHGWIGDYITYEFFDGQDANAPSAIFPEGPAFQYINTDLATLSGVEGHLEYDLAPRLTPFATLSYVVGRDQTRRQSKAAPSILALYGVAPGTARSGVDSAAEPLPGIAPLDVRCGLRYHEIGPDPRWAIEFAARMVNYQNRIAGSLLEQQTPGFTLLDLRAYWIPNEHVMIIAGIENLGDHQYREHLDIRAISDIFQPGLSSYVGIQLNY